MTAVLLVLTCLIAILGPSVGDLWGSAPPNLLTRDQQTFENGVQGWVPTGTSSLSAAKTPTYEGSRSLAVTAGKTPRYAKNVGWLVRFILSNSGAETLRGTSGIPVTPGWKYDGAVRVRAQKADRAVRCELNWFDQSGASLSSTAGKLSESKTTSWTKVTCSAKAPKGATTASLRVYFFGIRTGDVNYLDDAWLSTPDGTPPEAAFAMRINAGGPNAYKSPGGTLFQADQGFRGGLASGNIGGSIAGTGADSLYVKHRWGMSGYTIPVPSAATYTVRLHFAETVFNAPGKRVFDVSAEGTRRLAGFDVFAKAGADRAHIEQFDVRVTDGALVLGFTAKVEDPMVSGIEVLQRGSTATIATPSTTTTTTAAPTTTTTAAPTTTTTKPPAPTTTTTTAPPPPPTVPTPPPATGFPDTSNTGPTGALSSSGFITTTHAGQVIENVKVSGGIRVNHSNVVIRNVDVRGLIDINPATSGAKISYAYINCGGSMDPAIAHARFTVSYTEFENCGEGPRLNGDATMEHSLFWHMPRLTASAHADGVQIVCGSNITIRHNTIIMDDPGDSSNAAIMTGTACGPVSNVVIDNNLVAGGGYTIYPGTGYSGDSNGNATNATNVRVTNNRFSTKLGPAHPKSGYYGPLYSRSGITMSGNVWHETGAPI